MPDERLLRADHENAAQLRQAIGETSPVAAKLTEEPAPATVFEPPTVDEAQLRAEGFAAGRAAAGKEYEAECAAAKKMIAALEEGFARQLALEPDTLAAPLAKLAFAVAEAVVGESLAETPESVRTRVEDALARFREAAESPAIYVNPADACFFDAAAAGFELKTDPEVERGDFRLVQGDTQILDRIGSRFAEAKAALLP